MVLELGFTLECILSFYFFLDKAVLLWSISRISWFYLLLHNFQLILFIFTS